jgi:hypothetical protein
MRTALFALLCLAAPAAAQWTDLLAGGRLDAWEARGEAVWTVMEDGTLVGQRRPAYRAIEEWPVTREQFGTWVNQQAWLYTRADFEEYDLRLEYFLPAGGNSGISIRDTSRARYSFGPEWDPKRTPSHIGYEIQLNSPEGGKYPSGAIYLIAAGKPGSQRDGQWNLIEIESRRDLIRVRVNGKFVAETPGVEGRPKSGPIGLQLHDRFSWALFRNIRIREIR